MKKMSQKTKENKRNGTDETILYNVYYRRVTVNCGRESLIKNAVWWSQDVQKSYIFRFMDPFFIVFSDSFLLLSSTFRLKKDQTQMLHAPI